MKNVVTILNKRAAPMLLAYKQPKGEGQKGRGPKAKGHQLRPGRNDLGEGLGQLNPLVWAQVRESECVKMLMQVSLIQELSAEQPVPNEFDAGKSTLSMGVQEAITHISDLGSKDNFSLLNDIHKADSRPEVKAAIESRLGELAHS